MIQLFSILIHYSNQLIMNDFKYYKMSNKVQSNKYGILNSYCI